MKKSRQILLALLAAGTVLTLCTGCSRSELNYQLAECIGTLGEHENNEPVETPKMEAERKRRESEEAVENEKTAVLDQAAALAMEHYYAEAIAAIEECEYLQNTDEAEEAVKLYQEKLNGMFAYTGEIGHLSFTNLVVDTDRAFDGDEYSQVYRENMITLSEFETILDELYKSGYMLIDIHDLTEESGEGDDVTLTQSSPVIPKGKKPLILSVDNLNYSSVRNGDGVATKLVLNEEGEVAACYTDEGGHDLLGAYDVVPVLEQFIKEHPDFSFRGARGIIGLSGVSGAFGYEVEEGSSMEYEENREKVKAIADRLKADGWQMASMGYSYKYMRDMSYDGLKEDVNKWNEHIGSLVGDTDILIYPYGVEVDYETEKAAYLTNHGYHYLIGLWAGGDHCEVNETYLRQTRRTVTGYIFENYPNNYDTYFLTSVIKDSARK